jgi:membrane protein
MKVRELIGLVKQAAKNWWEGDTFQLGAALAYYAVFAIAPILVIALWIAGLVFGEQAAQGQLHERLGQALGPTVADAMEGTLRYAHHGDGGVLATAISVVVLLLGAIGFFSQLQTSLNRIWHAPPRPGRGVWGAVKDRLLSFAMVVIVGLLLVAALAVNTALAVVTGFFPGLHLPGGIYLWVALRWVISLGLLTLLFAGVYRVLPDVDIDWGDVWSGSAVTAVLFTLGNFLIGLYLGRTGVASTYGAAGSLVVVLMWVYYSSQVFLFGAEVTRTEAERRGHLRPAGGLAAAGQGSSSTQPAWRRSTPARSGSAG